MMTALILQEKKNHAGTLEPGGLKGTQDPVLN